MYFCPKCENILMNRPGNGEEWKFLLGLMKKRIWKNGEWEIPKTKREIATEILHITRKVFERELRLSLMKPIGFVFWNIGW